MIRLELVRGVGGFSVYLNGFRIAGEKPWGGGEIVAHWRVDGETIRRALTHRADPPTVEWCPRPSPSR